MTDGRLDTWKMLMIRAKLNMVLFWPYPYHPDELAWRGMRVNPGVGSKDAIKRISLALRSEPRKWFKLHRVDRGKHWKAESDPDWMGTWY